MDNRVFYWDLIVRDNKVLFINQQETHVTFDVDIELHEILPLIDRGRASSAELVWDSRLTYVLHLHFDGVRQNIKFIVEKETFDAFLPMRFRPGPYILT